ncbi:hypothetical protein [Tenacibaculum finnmarkense]|uniref:Uncharacterized protein n=1 Tax=Tenacibaculum finnmarkense genomovar ulcerans TaxID=2781388 RepID=A0A2I2M8R8_9FLAO|nr:hypothetical protein [Tenacibaculum finnmarkense]MBE7696884.1 hypothetical protein [Tenacibaculum finnmarkense genomovar ulcerans]SOU88928.1 conserved hypothetical protein. Putative phage abortive infection protein [Tenacibaculum finnmarkense genomovar ulcerans]
MIKKSKITVKHYLNTNLKPYIINDVKHYSVYLMLVAHRKNTKVKSIAFDNYYSESVFSEIINSKDTYDQDLIRNEITALTLISEITINELKEFDTAFITSYFKYSSKNFIDSLAQGIDILNQNSKNQISCFINCLHLNSCFLDYTSLEYISILDFFGYKIQNLLKNYFKNELNSKDCIKDIELFNKHMFYSSLKRFEKTIIKTKNYYLIEKYSNSFNKISNIECRNKQKYYESKDYLEDLKNLEKKENKKK